MFLTQLKKRNGLQNCLIIVINLSKTKVMAENVEQYP